MGYQECYKETNELAAERYELVAERIAEIAEAAQAPEPFAEYFRTNAAYLQSLRALYEKGKSGSLAARSMEECETDNEALYGEILPEAYGHSYANPAYAAARLGETFGGALSLLAAHLRTACGEVFRGNLMQLTIAMELFVEVYNCFEGAAADALPQEKEVQQILYWYFHDYREIFDERSVRRLVNPAEDFEKEIVMQADLSDLRYLYRYGAYIGENERQIAAYLNTLPEADIQAMADTYTEGYRIGFETTGKDLSKKTAAQVRYPIGFERMVRAAVCNFEKMGLEVTMLASGTAANKQYDYDHREDCAYYLDKAYVERGLETWKNAFEEEKAEFLKTWFQVGCRNKKIYIDAFLNTTLGFWYPDVEDEYLEFVCFDIQKDDPHYPHVQMEPKSEWLNQYYTAIGTDASFRQIPVVRELLSMGLYFWLLVLASLYLIYQKEYGKLLWILPLWMYLGTSLLGPAALLRYGYPLMAACPILLFTMWKKEA